MVGLSEVRSVHCYQSQGAAIQAAHLIIASLLCMPIAYHSMPNALKGQKFPSDLSVHMDARGGISYRHVSNNRDALIKCTAWTGTPFPFLTLLTQNVS